MSVIQASRGKPPAECSRGRKPVTRRSSRSIWRPNRFTSPTRPGRTTTRSTAWSAPQPAGSTSPSSPATPPSPTGARSASCG